MPTIGKSETCGVAGHSDWLDEWSSHAHNAMRANQGGGVCPLDSNPRRKREDGEEKGSYHPCPQPEKGSADDPEKESGVVRGAVRLGCTDRPVWDR